MNYIDIDTATALSKHFGHWSGQTIEANDVGIHALCNAAIAHYIETSVSELTGKPYTMPVAQPDCRTCTFFRAGPALHADNCYRSFEGCTNGDKYQPAPKVVLWRTE